MVETILALHTPRGGENESNYRFVVPKGKKWSDLYLAQRQQALGTETKSKYGIIFKTEERQKAGRLGDVAFYLYREDFYRFSRKQRDACQELMQKWFEDKQKTISWKSAGGSTVVERDELSCLAGRIKTILAWPPPRPAIPGSKVLWGVAAFLALAVVGIFFCSVDSKPPVSPLYSLFEFESPRDQTEENLKKALDLTWRFYCNKSGTSLEDYLRNDDVKRLLSQLNSTSNDAEQILVIGENSPDKNWKSNFNGINPVRFHQTIEALVALQEASSQLPEGWLKNVLQRSEIDRGAKNLKWNLQGVWPKFYFPGIPLPDGTTCLSDLRNMETLKTVLGDIILEGVYKANIESTEENKIDKALIESMDLRRLLDLILIDNKEWIQAECENYNNQEFRRFLNAVDLLRRVDAKVSKRLNKQE